MYSTIMCKKTAEKWLMIQGLDRSPTILQFCSIHVSPN